MKKENIIEAARELFHKFGFKRVSMNEIAQVAGVTKRTIYMNFENKEELLKYFVEEEILKMKEIIEETEKENLEFFETVNKAIVRLLKYRKEKDFLNIIRNEAELLKNPILLDSLKMIDDHIQNYIKEKLEYAKKNGYIDYDNLEVTTYLIYKMYIALMLEWKDEGNVLDEQVIANNITHILKNGLRKEV